MTTTVSLSLDRTCFYGQRIETNERNESQRCLIVALAPYVVRRKHAEEADLASDGRLTDFGLVFPWGYAREDVEELARIFNCCESTHASAWELVDHAEGQRQVDSRALALLASGVASIFGQGQRKLNKVELVSGDETLLSSSDTVRKCGGLLDLDGVLFRAAGARASGEPPKGLSEVALRIAEVKPGEFCQYPRNLPLTELTSRTLGELAGKQSFETRIHPTRGCATLPIGHMGLGNALSSTQEEVRDFDCRLWLGREDFEQWPDR